VGTLPEKLEAWTVIAHRSPSTAEPLKIAHGGSEPCAKWGPSATILMGRAIPGAAVRAPSHLPPC